MLHPSIPFIKYVHAWLTAMSQTIMYLHIMTLVQTKAHQTFVRKDCSWAKRKNNGSLLLQLL